MDHFIACGLQDASHYVLVEESAEVADVGLGVDGGTAAVHADDIAFGGNDGFRLAGKGVVECDLLQSMKVEG
jgi:hypothetical protein